MKASIIEQLTKLSDPAQLDLYLKENCDLVNDLDVIGYLKERVTHFVRVDANQALKIADIAWRLSNLAQDPLARALGIRTKALALWAKGDYEASLDLFKAAEQIYGDMGMELEVARIARSKVDVLMYLGRYSEALEAARRAREVFQAQGEEVLLAQLDVNVGNIYHRLDQPHKALEFYDRARALFLQINDPPSIGFVELNRANALSILNEIDQSFSLYEKARDLLTESGMPLVAAQAEYNLAYLNFLKRDYNEALRLFDKVKAFHLSIGNEITAALCDLDILEIYLELNLFEEVLERSPVVEDKFERLRMSYEAAKVKTFRAIANIHLKNYASAEEDLRKAGDIFLREGNEVYSAMVSLHLAELKRQTENYQEAIRLYKSAREAFLQNKLLLKASHAQTRLAGVKLHMGDRAAAESLCTETLNLLGDRNTPWLAFQCYHLLGNLTRDDDYDHAYQCFRKAIDCIEHMCGNIQPDEFKSSFLKDKLSVYEDMVLLCLRQDDDAKREEAFSYVERAKSRSLIDLLARTYRVKAKEVKEDDKAIYHKWEQLRAELNWLYDRAMQNESKGKQRSVVVEEKLNDEIKLREKALTNLLRDLQLKDEEYSSLQAVTTITVPELQTYLSDDEVLIEYYFAGDTLSTFVIGKDSLHVATNPVRWNQISLLLQGLQFQLEKFLYGPAYIESHFDSLRKGADEYLAQLYQALIEPVASLIEGKHLIIVPFGILHYVPFHALYDGSRYLIETREVSYAPSACIFRLCQEKDYGPCSKTSPSATILGQGFQPRPKGGALKISKALILGVPGKTIPQIEEEVRVIKELFPEGKLFIGSEATRTALQDHAYDCNIIHLAAHGTFRYDNPLFSGFKLADSWLSFYDIYGLTLNADLVTLSGCHSGISQVAHGDELLGLMRGFLYAGAASLVASLWAADDRSTAEFMKIFYTKLKGGLSKRSALCLAQREIKERYNHPYYWAPFTLVGKR